MSAPPGRDAAPSAPPATAVARSALWNLGGQLLPLAVALAAIPFLARGLGADRYGLLILVWSVIGYFGFLDLGLGRALTALLARSTAAGESGRQHAVAWTALWFLLALGVAGGTALAACARPLARSWLAIPPALAGETERALLLLAPAVPLVTLTSACRGILEARGRFDLSNLARIPLAVLALLGPLAVLPFSDRLEPAVGTLVLGRAAGLALHWRYCRIALGGIGRPRPPVRTELATLLRFGGWMTVSNVVGPLLGYLDRFLLAATLSAAAVAWYATPQDAITRLALVPAALVGVLFPLFAGGAPAGAAVPLYGRSLKLLLAALLPGTLVAAALAFPLLDLWLGTLFAREGAPVLRWLAAGVLLNGLAHVPLALVQGAGRPDLAARLHVAELPLYAVALATALPRYGVTGCAAVWTLRAGVDALVLAWLAARLRPGLAAEQARLALPLGLALAAHAAAGLVRGTAAAALAALAGLAATLAALWFGALTAGERDRLARWRAPRR